MRYDSQPDAPICLVYSQRYTAAAKIDKEKIDVTGAPADGLTRRFFPEPVAKRHHLRGSAEYFRLARRSRPLNMTRAPELGGAAQSAEPGGLAWLTTRATNSAGLSLLRWRASRSSAGRSRPSCGRRMRKPAPG